MLNFPCLICFVISIVYKLLFVLNSLNITIFLLSYTLINPILYFTLDSTTILFTVVDLYIWFSNLPKKSENCIEVLPKNCNSPPLPHRNFWTLICNRKCISSVTPIRNETFSPDVQRAMSAFYDDPPAWGKNWGLMEVMLVTSDLQSWSDMKIILGHFRWKFFKFPKWSKKSFKGIKF